MQLLTPREVAHLLNCSTSAIYKWVSEERLKPARAGNLLRFTVEEIERFAGLRRGSLRDTELVRR